MKLKILNTLVTMLAVVGVFIAIGAVGTCDYMVETGQYYPLSQTIKTLLFGCSLTIPAIVREVL